MKYSIFCHDIWPGHLVEFTNTEKITELQLYLTKQTRSNSSSFWVGSSDLEENGMFRWFYSGDEVADDLWSVAPKKENHCVSINKGFMKFSAKSCDDVGYYICEVSFNTCNYFVIISHFTVSPRALPATR